jgi:hypothetical protein
MTFASSNGAIAYGKKITNYENVEIAINKKL